MEENLDLEELQRLDMTPLCGATNERPMCYLLEIDDLRILLDCGWSEEFNVQDLEPLRNIVHTLDVCLITFPDLHHMGGLPYAMSEFGLSCPIILSRACGELGILNLYEIYLSYETTRGFSLFDLSDIDLIKDYYINLTFGQRLNIYDIINTGKQGEVQLIIQKSGRVVGGSSYKLIRKDEIVLYAPNFNHRTEEHLSPIDLLKAPLPTVLITDCNCYGKRTKQEINRKDKVSLMINQILQRLRNNANVLIPVSLARVCEILLILEQQWEKRKLSYSISYVSSVSKSFLKFLKSNLEYLNSDLNARFVKTNRPVLDFKHITFCSDIKECVSRTREPRVVLVSYELLENGHHKDLFFELVQQKRALLLFVERPFNVHSLSRKLVNHLENKSTTILPQLKIRTYKWVYHTPLQLLKWKEDQKELMVQEERKKLQQEQEALLTQDFLTQDTDEQKQQTSMNLMKILFKKTKDIKTKIVFSNNELERFSKFTEYGESIKENDFSVYNAPALAQQVASTENILYPELVKREDKFVDYPFGNVLNDSCLSKKFRQRLPRENISEDVSLFIKCDIQYIGFNGQTDSKSLKYFLEEMKVRNLVLLNGTKQDSESFKKDIQVVLSKNAKVIVPNLKELTSVRSTLTSWQVIFDKRILSSETNILFRPLQSVAVDKDTSIDVGYVDGVIAVAEAKQETEDEPVANKEEPIFIPKLLNFDTIEGEGENKPKDIWTLLKERKRKRMGITTSYDKLLLSKGTKTVVDIQKVLEANGIKTRFWEGALQCEEDISVRKVINQDNIFEVTGYISEKYFQTRKLMKRSFVEV